MNKILAIKRVKEVVPSLGLREAKELVEYITPMLQWSSDELERHVEALEHRIANFGSYAGTSLERREQLKALVIERDRWKAVTQRSLNVRD